MNSTERIKALLENKPFDKIGISGWLHMPLVDRNPDDYVRAEIAFRDYQRWDFIKIMTNPHQLSEAYGGVIEFSRDPKILFGKFIKYPISSPADAASLRVLDRSNLILLREAGVTRKLRAHYQGTVPLLATIFSPLMGFQEMFGPPFDPAPLREFMRLHRDELHHALNAITETLINFADAHIEAGADGIFIATQFASELLSQEEFAEFSRPYDLRILNHIKDKTWFNLLHVHGNKNLAFDRVLDYPVQAINWENASETVPEQQLTSITKLRSLTDKLLITGIAHNDDFHNGAYDREKTKEILTKRLKLALEESGDGRIIFAPGCGLPQDLDYFPFSLISEVAEEFGQSVR